MVRRGGGDGQVGEEETSGRQREREKEMRF
jgi:hypothetical protein